MNGRFIEDFERSGALVTANNTADEGFSCFVSYWIMNKAFHNSH